MNKRKKYLLLLSALLVPVILYYYFSYIKSDCFYGDDAYAYINHIKSNEISELIKDDVSIGKYRPVHSTATHFLYAFAQKNVSSYYLFNIAVQTINVLLFAILVNLFLNAPFLSLFVALAVGISRFTIFNITQLFMGGSLEGMSVTFLILSLYFICLPIVRNDQTASQKIKNIFLSILFANASMYTHERYIVILPFLGLIILFFPVPKAITLKQRLIVSGAAAISLVLNVVIKKYIVGIPFFVGTGGTHISFSFSQAISFLTEAVLSILQINKGPEYLTGLQFTELSLICKILVFLMLGTLIYIIVLYLAKLKKQFTSWKALLHNKHFIILASLLILFASFLAPAIVTIRLEQRWLQASFNILLLMVTVAISALSFKGRYTKYALFALFLIPFVITDNRYFYKGGERLYLWNAHKNAMSFKQAVDDGTIHPSTTNLYIWEKQRDENNEQGFNWDLGGGYFFTIYQNKGKKIIFVDSIYYKNSNKPVSSFPNFNKNNDQIIYKVQNRVIDITNEYLKDSLKSFTTKKIYRLESGDMIQYDQKHLKIENSNFDKFDVEGFYQNENGLRWTNGKAEIGFKGDFSAKDTVQLILNTYMPPAYKGINPTISIVDDDNKTYYPISSKREGDKFLFNFYFSKLSFIQKVNISADTISVTPPDTRILSFPFVNLEIKSN